MSAIYKRELHAYLTSAIGYAFIALFFAVSGGVFVYTTLYAGTANPANYYSYMLVFFVILLPILTMKSFSEERKLRTEQLLLTAPVSSPLGSGTGLSWPRQISPRTVLAEAGTPKARSSAAMSRRQAAQTSIFRCFRPTRSASLRSA